VSRREAISVAVHAWSALDQKPGQQIEGPGLAIRVLLGTAWKQGLHGDEGRVAYGFDDEAQAVYEFIAAQAAFFFGGRGLVSGRRD